MNSCLHSHAPLTKEISVYNLNSSYDSCVVKVSTPPILSYGTRIGFPINRIVRTNNVFEFLKSSPWIILTSSRTAARCLWIACRYVVRVVFLYNEPSLFLISTKTHPRCLSSSAAFMFAKSALTCLCKRYSLNAFTARDINF